MAWDLGSGSYHHASEAGGSGSRLRPRQRDFLNIGRQRDANRLKELTGDAGGGGAQQEALAILTVVYADRFSASGAGGGAISAGRSAHSGPQFFQTFPAVLVQRIVVGDPLAEQQSSNAVRVLNALPQQRCALARDRAAVLFARAWRHCHGADPRLASLPSHQRAQQRLAVDRIGLGAPVASGHGNRRRIDAGSTTWLSTPLASSKR